MLINEDRNNNDVLNHVSFTVGGYGGGAGVGVGPGGLVPVGVGPGGVRLGGMCTYTCLFAKVFSFINKY